MRKLLPLQILLCLMFLFLDGLVCHPVCYFARETLTTTKKEKKCRNACIDYKGEERGECFAYVFSSRYKTCVGYVFDFSGQYVDYKKCGANYGADLSFKEGEESDDDYYDAYYASDNDSAVDYCLFQAVTLGIAATEQICEELCTSFKEENASELYGGCAAWFWNPDNEECVGVMSEKYAFGGICSSIEKQK